MDEKFDWTPAVIERMRDLWIRGIPTTEIADTIGAPSKNAVIAKAKREKFPDHPAAKRHGVLNRAKVTQPKFIRPVLIPASTERRAPPKLAPVKTEDADAMIVLPHANEALPESRLLSLFDLKLSTCRWPLGDPQQPGFAFCGADCDPARSYCATHTLLARGIGTPSERIAHNLKSSEVA